MFHSELHIANKVIRPTDFLASHSLLTPAFMQVVIRLGIDTENWHMFSYRICPAVELDH